MKFTHLPYLSVTILILIGCSSSKYNYIPPPEIPKIESSIIVKEKKDNVWNKLIKGIAPTFLL